MLEAAPGLTAMTLLEELQRRHPEQYEVALLRTLQRRVRAWNALHGGEREVFFAQAHPPGRLGLSDFTHAAVLRVTIAGAALMHLLYQFALAFSGWRYVEVVLGGESFVALSSGLQNAVWMMGGVPEEHRTDVSGLPSALYKSVRNLRTIPRSSTSRKNDERIRICHKGSTERIAVARAPGAPGGER